MVILFFNQNVWRMRRLGMNDPSHDWMRCSLTIAINRSLVFYRAAFDSDIILDAVAAEDRASYFPWPNPLEPSVTGLQPVSSSPRRRHKFPETWLWHNQFTEYY